MIHSNSTLHIALLYALLFPSLYLLHHHLARTLGVFLDECDAVAWNRDANTSAESGNLRRATNSIFQGMDQMSHNIVFAAATNMLHRLLSAFKENVFPVPEAPNRSNLFDGSRP